MSAYCISSLVGQKGKCDNVQRPWNDIHKGERNENPPAS